MGKNYYELLGIKPGVSHTEIKRSYRKLARKYHPDSGEAGTSKELFLAITAAYDTLSSPEKREHYDRLHGFALQSEIEPDDQQQSSERESPDEAKRRAEGEQAYRRQRPADGSFGAKTDRMQSTANAGPNSARFAGIKPTETQAPEQRSEGLFQKLSGFIKPTRAKQSAATTTKPPGKTARQNTEPTDIRGPREYFFTIDALESIRGTSREVALKNDDGTPRVIRVKIPPLVRSGATLKVPISSSETARIHINVISHPIVSRENDDITIRVPITLLEALQGADIDVPSPQGPVRVRIPPKTADEKKFRVKGRGIKRVGASDSGDLYVDTYIVLPTSLSEVAKQAAQALEAHYNSDVRKDLPRQLNLASQAAENS